MFYVHDSLDFPFDPNKTPGFRRLAPELIRDEVMSSLRKLRKDFDELSDMATDVKKILDAFLSLMTTPGGAGPLEFIALRQSQAHVLAKALTISTIVDSDLGELTAVSAILAAEKPKDA